MKKILTALLLIVCMTGIAFAEEPAPSQAGVDARFTAANEWLSKNNMSVTKSPEQAFITDYILVAEEGLPSATSRSAAQRRLTAKRAATALAYRKLAEILEGVAVVGDTLVKDAELQYDVVRTAVSGVVKAPRLSMKNITIRKVGPCYSQDRHVRAPGFCKDPL